VDPHTASVTGRRHLSITAALPGPVAHPPTPRPRAPGLRRAPPGRTQRNHHHDGAMDGRSSAGTVPCPRRDAVPYPRLVVVTPP